MREPNRSEERRWREARVDAGAEHLRLYSQEDEEPSALVGAPRDNCFPVEFSLDDASGVSAAEERRQAVRAQLDLYLLDVGRPDPWRHAICHCGQGRQSLLRRSLDFHAGWDASP